MFSRVGRCYPEDHCDSAMSASFTMAFSSSYLTIQPLMNSHLSCSCSLAINAVASSIFDTVTLDPCQIMVVAHIPPHTIAVIRMEAHPGRTTKAIGARNRQGTSIINKRP